ncbi:MAG: 16S rRNA (cytosine(967)-C(5))-methyltransferase RsmB [Oscillospiraceae bacterium]|nr:16S rRNA (cytosine(967)-C(5))-methyltransferase RsmB [Oscillospiraceae bacterium]
MSADARTVAVDALGAVDRGAYSELYLASAIGKAGLDRRDAALCTAICGGVLRSRAYLDFRLAACSSIKLKKIAPRILNILRAAAFQILSLDRVPDSAAVNAAVDQARKAGGARSAGFVNAVLRRLSREKDAPPELDRSDEAQYLSVLYSHPVWLVRRFLDALGREETEKLLEINNTPAPVVVRVNTLRADAEQVREALSKEDVECTPHPFLPDALILSRTGSIDALAAYREGLFTVQDSASQLCVLALDPKPGSSVLDVCAAPGGKSFACAALMRGRGRIVACDLHEQRAALIAQGAERLGIACIEARQADGTVWNPEWENAFDCVLVDAPCSGIGVIRRKSEIRYKEEASLGELPAVQRAILENASRYVRPGGVLVYSTCTLLPEENEAVYRGFLERNGEFSPFDFILDGLGASENGCLTLWPQKTGTDGFFVSKMRRKDAESSRS